MKNSQISNNIVHLKTQTNARDVLQNALSEVDNTLGVIVIRIDSKHSASAVFSNMSGYQMAYAKWTFNEMVDKLLTTTLNNAPVIK